MSKVMEINVNLLFFLIMFVPIFILFKWESVVLFTLAWFCFKYIVYKEIKDLLFVGLYLLTFISIYPVLHKFNPSIDNTRDIFTSYNFFIIFICILGNLISALIKKRAKKIEVDV